MGTVFGKNTTSAPIIVAGHKVYYIDSADAEIVEVEDGNNVKYNAFKYTLSGTPYWYVIDGEHDTWTDDLSEWGYSEVQPAPVLPTVILMAYSSNEWNYPASFNTNPLTFVSGEQAQLYIASGTSFSYESDKVYSVGEYQNPSGTTTGRYGFSVVSVNSKIGCKNISGGSITIQRMSVYRCSDSTATVITVYDSLSVAYNAFKFTAGDTDYYYVLDGTQTDWTDDLAGIGYHDYEEIVLYMPGGTGRTYGSQYGVTSGYTGDPNSQYLYPLYSDPECTIPALYDAAKRYEAGYYQTGEWTAKQIQTVTDMPSFTVSQFSDKTTAEILHNDNGVMKLWSINNYVSSSPSYAFSYVSNPVSFRFRLRSDGGGGG